MTSDEHRQNVLTTLRNYGEAVETHIRALHRMYAEGLLPEKVYLGELSMSQREQEAIHEAIQLIIHHKNAGG
jgi:hypothetical protein